MPEMPDAPDGGGGMTAMQVKGEAASGYPIAHGRLVPASASDLHGERIDPLAGN
jgi:hypothetical protein